MNEAPYGDCYNDQSVTLSACFPNSSAGSDYLEFYSQIGIDLNFNIYHIVVYVNRSN